MLFTEYLESIANTEQEAEFMEKFAALQEHLTQVPNLPIVGKVIKSLIALGDAESIEDFMETEEFHAFGDWEITFNPSGGFSLKPGATFRKKALKVLVIVVVGFIAWRLLRKRRRG